MKKLDIIIYLTIGVLFGFSINYIVDINTKNDKLNEDIEIVNYLKLKLKKSDSTNIANLNMIDSLYSAKIDKIVQRETVKTTFKIGDKTLSVDEFLVITNEESKKLSDYTERLEFLENKFGFYFTEDQDSFKLNYTDNSIIQKNRKELAEKNNEISKLKQVISSVEKLEKIKITYREEGNNIIVAIEQQ